MRRYSILYSVVVALFFTVISMTANFVFCLFEISLLSAQSGILWGSLFVISVWFANRSLKGGVAEKSSKKILIWMTLMFALIFMVIFFGACFLAFSKKGMLTSVTILTISNWIIVLTGIGLSKKFAEKRQQPKGSF